LPVERTEITGTLKEGAAALPCDEDIRASFVARLGNRPTWLAASTHEGEEEQVLAAHRLALKSNPRLLLILAPRHADRGDSLAEMLQADGWSYARRAAGELPDKETQVYLADTMGELGLWYRIAPVSFVGGSLMPIGGHNPFEPAALGSAILHGPYITNFVDIYQRLTDVRAARLVSRGETLAQAVDDLMNPDKAAAMANAAWEVSSVGAVVTDQALDLLLDTIDKTGAS